MYKLYLCLVMHVLNTAGASKSIVILSFLMLNLLCMSVEEYIWRRV